MSGIKTFMQSDLRVPPTEGNHLVRLSDMQMYVAGLTKAAVRAVLDTPFTGAYNAVALTLTAASVAASFTVDGVVLAIGDRLLLKAQIDATQNGIYVVTALSDGLASYTVLTRADDLNESADIVAGTIIPVTEGDINANTRWKLTPASIPAVLDATALTVTKEVTITTKVVEMAFDIVGDGTTVAFAFNHNLDTLNVTHEIREVTTGETVIAHFKRTNGNSVTVTFADAPATGEDYALILRAEVEPS